MRLGLRGGFLDLAVFLVILIGLLALTARGIPDVTGFVWWVLVLVGSVYLVWKVWKARKTAQSLDGSSRWGAVVPPKIWRWMIGEDDADTKPKR